MVLHDLNLAARFSDLLLMLNDGRVFAAGSTRDVLNEANIRAVYGVKARILNRATGYYVIPLKPV